VDARRRQREPCEGWAALQQPGQVVQALSLSSGGSSIDELKSCSFFIITGGGHRPRARRPCGVPPLEGVVAAAAVGRHHHRASIHHGPSCPL
jgi:hypothetical protein